MVNQQAKEQLSSSLLEALRALAQVANEQSIPTELPAYSYDVVWFQDVGGRGEPQRVSRTEPSLYSVPDLLKQLVVHEPVASSMETLASTMSAIVVEGSWPVSAGPQPSPDGLAERLILTFVKEVGSLFIDTEVATRISSQFIDDVLSSTVSVVSAYLIEHFTASEAFLLNEHDRFRPISMKDFEQFGAIEPGGWPGFDRPWLNSSNWICETGDAGPKDTSEARNRHRDHIEEILGALGLTSSGRVSCRLLSSRLSSPFFGGGTISNGNISYTSGSGSAVALDDAGVERFKGNYALVRRIFVEPQLEYLRLPFRRLRAAASRSENEDRLVDYVIGLERLLVRDSESLEVTFRFRLRGASLLPSTFGDADERKRFMGKLYKLRSDIVHGNVETARVNEMVPQAEDALRAIFLWFGKISETAQIQNVIKNLDNALVEGGSVWAEAVYKTN